MLSLNASACALTYKSFAVGKLRKCDFAFLVLKRVSIVFIFFVIFVLVIFEPEVQHSE